MKKFKIFILTLLMVFTILPINTLANEESPSQELDFTVYAYKGNLTSNEAYGHLANRKAKIFFGKDSSGNPLEWYLSGNDGEGEPNILIFSASPIAKLKFNSTTDNKDYSYDKKTGYGENAGTVTVFANHYGASDIRKALQDIAKSTDYFTQVEQDLMNESTITTKDINNIIKDSNVLYTTSDKLYLPSFSGDKYGKFITFGSGDGKIIDLKDLKDVIPLSSFILRAPASSSTDVYMCAYENDVFTITSAVVTNPADVYVATNLNAKDILFASAAKAGKTSKIDVNTTMSFRLDGTNKNIGKVFYYPDDTIEVTKGSASNVTLMIQGKNNDINWSYSKVIDQDTTVKKSEIIDELNNKVYVDDQTGNVTKITGIDLVHCQIWLETTDTDGTIYAVEAIEAITDINIIDIDAPVAMQALDEKATCHQRGVHLPEHPVIWEPADTIAKYNEIYTASITLENSGISEFVQNVNVTVNGEKANIISNDGYNLTVSYTFPKTNDKLNSIVAPEEINYQNGTSLDDIIKSLPKALEVQTEGGSVTSLPVTWNTTSLNSYKPEEENEQTFTITGELTVPDNILYDNKTFDATVTIKKLIYLTDGDNQTVVIDGTKTASFRSNDDFKEFKAVKVDGSVIASSNYTVTEGSIIVTLNDSYLATLSAGEHTIIIVSTYGEAKGKFIIKKPITVSTVTYDGYVVPNTGVK